MSKDQIMNARESMALKMDNNNSTPKSQVKRSSVFGAIGDFLSGGDKKKKEKEKAANE